MRRIPAARSICLALAFSACGSGPAPEAPPGGPLEPVTRQVYLMGTIATLTVYAEDKTLGGQRIEDFLKVLERAESQLSSWRGDSLVSRLNRHPIGDDFSLPAPVCRLFAEVFRWNQRSGGAFDPAVQPLISAWGLRGRARLPEPAELEDALARSGLRRLRFDSDECLVARLADTGIDTGAFGKGAGLDWIRDTAGAEELSWLVDLGGQIAVGAQPPGRSGWEVGLADPVRRDSAALELQLDSGSLATSGGSERDLESEGVRVGHILDPRTGRPAPYRGSVSVWHESALTADILSTALYVMGPEKGLPWAESQGVAAIFLTEAGARLTTRPFEQRFLLR